MWIQLFLSAFTASALPPFPECRDFLIPPEARAAFGRVIGAHPGYDRAFVGHLMDFWQTDDRRFVYWNIYDRHNQHQVFPRRDAYVHTLREGDHLELFDEAWRPIGGGAFTTTDQGFFYRDLSGFTTLPTRAAFASWRGTKSVPPAPETHWLHDRGRAIVLSRMNAADWSEWTSTDAPEHRKFLRALARPRFVRGADFEHLLAHYEDAVEVRMEYAPFDREFAKVTLLDGALSVLPGRREMIYFFDGHDRFIDRAKAFNDQGAITLWSATDLETALERLARARRVVVVRRSR